MTRLLILVVTALALSGAAASAQPFYYGYGYSAPYLAPPPVWGGPIYDYAPGYYNFPIGYHDPYNWGLMSW